MIEQLVVNGKAAIVCWLTTNYEPSTKEQAEIAKIIYGDGDVEFFKLSSEQVKDEFDPDEPRNEKGEWTTGGGGGTSKKPTGTAEKFDREKWTSMGMGKARGEWQKLSRAEKDGYAQAKTSVADYVRDIAGSHSVPDTGNAMGDVRARIHQLKDYVPERTRGSLDRFMQSTHDALSQASSDQKAVRNLCLDMTDHMVAQEYESMGRSLGDHGVRHLAQDAWTANEFLRVVPGNINTPANRAAMYVAAAYHDTGYLTPPSRAFLDADHPRWSTQHFRANVADKVRPVLGDDGADLVSTLIATHSQTDIDWQNEPEESAFSTADNLALFHHEKIPPFVRDVPGNINSMVDLARGKLTVAQAKEQMKFNVAKSPLHPKLKEKALGAVAEVSGVLPKYMLGVLGTSFGGVEWKEDHPVVTVERHRANEQLSKVIDFGQQQFFKLAETYSTDPKELIDKGEMKVNSKEGKTLLEVRSIGPVRDSVSDQFDLFRDYDPDQPRGPDGRWSSNGSSASSAPADPGSRDGGIKAYLEMVSKISDKSSEHFVLTHGRPYSFDASSFVGGGGIHECYSNAGRLALRDSGKTYVEGFVSVHGIPLQHAWVVGKDGKVVDPTISDPEGIVGYYGVPFKRGYLAQVAAKTKVWGLISYTNRDLWREDPKEFLKDDLIEDYDPDEPRNEKGEWTTGGGSEKIESGVGRQFAFHGATRDIEKFSILGEPDETFMPDRMLGYHFAKDPAVSNAFVMERINEEERGAKEGGKIIPVVIPSDKFMLEADQPQYEWAKGQPPNNHNVETDEVAIGKMIAREAYPSRPDILAKFLETSRAMKPDEAKAAAETISAGGTVNLPLDGPHDLNRLVNNFVGAFPHNKDDKRELVRTARESWQAKGYKGIKYVNTSPMETMKSAGVKDPTSYVIFDPKHIRGRYTGDMAGFNFYHTQDTLRDYDPDEPRNEKGEWTTGGAGVAEGTSASAEKATGENEFVDRLRNSRASISGSELSWVSIGKSQGEVNDQAVEAVAKFGSKNPIEHLAWVEVAPGGEHMMGLTIGDKRSVGMPLDMRRAMNEGTHINVYHNHPQPYPLSDADVEIAAKFPNVHSITAVTDNGLGVFTAHMPSSEGKPQIPNSVEKMYSYYMTHSYGNITALDEIHDKLISEEKHGKKIEDSMQFLEQHADLLALSKAGFFKYEYRLAPWQSVLLTKYEKPFSQCVEARANWAHIVKGEM